jgi:hypothetical protein
MKHTVPVLLAAALVALAAGAQPPSQSAQPFRIRGTVKSFDGGKLSVATRADGVAVIDISDRTGINGLQAKTLRDIGANTFIGATAVKDSAGRWQATEIHIFPEAMRGAGEGHYAWDLPESSMTNGAVTGNTAGSGGNTLHVTYAGGATDVEVTKKTAIVALTQGNPELLKPGATVFVLAIPQLGGGAAAVAVIAETNGVKPPM